MMKLRVKKLHEDAILPVYATAGAACFDLHAVIDKPFIDWTAEPGTAFPVIRTGLAFEIPPGWAMKIYSRSGHGFKYGVRLVNGTGLIDADYRGEILVGLHNDSNGFVTIRHGDRIAQAMLVPVERIEFDLVEELSDTARGAGGFGSTGA